MPSLAPAATARSGFRHEALLYPGAPSFASSVAPVVRSAVESGEAVLVVATRPRVEALREELGDLAAKVGFADMGEVGRNPARIIPAWREFLDDNPAGPVLGIGEPIYAARSAAELVECQRHEALLNVAFGGAGVRSWRLVCPYDTQSLPEPVLDEARHTHPAVLDRGSELTSVCYDAAAMTGRHVDDPLPEPPRVLLELTFGTGRMAQLRRVVGSHAARYGVAASRLDDLVVSVDEVANNSIEHGGGHGLLRLWRDSKALVCEVRDAGVIGDPLVGRRRPDPRAERGRGLWLANQLCDLVQVRTGSGGTTVRLHVTIDTD
jgi:anti-sigma regulatory factor (Ser/Thr protein kinase)